MPCSYSRAELVAHIAAGRSVIVNGQHYHDVASLPSEADLAHGDAHRLETALQAAQMKAAAAEKELAEVKAKLADAHNAAGGDPCSDPKPPEGEAPKNPPTPQNDPPKSPPFRLPTLKGGD